ncbi:hypothetical protein Dimus_018683 [Dionaea muscipula]
MGLKHRVLCVSGSKPRPPLSIPQVSESTLSSSSSSHQALAAADAKPISNPLYHFLPDSQNPNKVVDLICSTLKQNTNTASVPKGLERLVPHLGNDEISRVLLRLQSEARFALTFFNWVKNDLGLRPSIGNYCIAVHVLAWSRNYSPAMRLLSELIELGSPEGGGVDVFDFLVMNAEPCNWDPAVFDMLIKAYVKVGRVREAYRAFRKMARIGFVPHIVAFNCLLNGLSMSNYIDECWEIYQVMWRIGITPNTVTFNMLTHLLCKTEDIDRVNEFLEKMEEEGFEPDIVTYNILISSYCKKKRLDDAFYLYNIMYRRSVVPDLVTHTSLMNGLCRAGRMRESRQIFNRMTDCGLRPDIVAYNSIISGYCKEGKMKESRALLHDMIRNGISPDSFTCHALVGGYGREGQWLSALNMVVELKRFVVSIPRDIYEYLVLSLCSQNHPFAVMKLLDRMVEDGHDPTEEMYGKLIESLCSNDYVAEALLYKNKMVEKSIKPSLNIFRTLISCFCRFHRYADAESLMQEMVEFGLQPDCTICRALVIGYCEEQNVDKVEYLLLSFATEYQLYDSESYNALVKICSNHGDLRKLMELQEKLLNLGFSPNSMTCKHVIEGLQKTLEKEKHARSIRHTI